MPVMPGMLEKDQVKISKTLLESGLCSEGEKEPGCLSVADPRWLYVAVFICGPKRVTSITLCFAPGDPGKQLWKIWAAR